MSQRPLPLPATQADEYLYAIASDLKALVATIGDLIATLTPPPAAPVADLAEETAVELSEPAPKSKGKPAAKLSEE